MKDDSLQNPFRNLSRRAFVSTGAAAILSTRLLAAEEIAISQTEGNSLPAWNDGPSKDAVLRFVRDTTDKSSPKYVEPADRIATCDQDGTRWAGHRIYGQGEVENE